MSNTCFVAQISLPDSADVRILPEGNIFELHYEWKQELLSFLLFYSGGSFGQITWGVRPADTGAKNNPGKSELFHDSSSYFCTSLTCQVFFQQTH